MSSKSKFFERYKGVVDKYGFDVTSYKSLEPFVAFLFRHWFDVQIVDIENIPAEGNALVFGNHSGGLPIDAVLLYDGFVNQHSKPRRMHFLVTKVLYNLPVLGKAIKGYGCVPPDLEITIELLKAKELVGIYPEAEKGTGKLFKDRYHLVDFHEGFVRAALETQSPLIPVVTIGGEEVYPILANIKPLAKLLKWPYFPLTPFFPWLPFPFFAVPLPAKILICVWPQFELKYPPEAAENEPLVAEIARDIRGDVQAKINDLLALRTSPFAHWHMEQVLDYLRSDRAFFATSTKHRR